MVRYRGNDYSVPVAYAYHDVNAVSIGGDTDTIACITGGIAEVMFGVPDWIAQEARSHLREDLVRVLDQFLETRDAKVVDDR